jgi:hypothetical protein
MFKLDTIDLQRITVSTVGAAILSAALVLSAVAPAQGRIVAAHPLVRSSN